MPRSPFADALSPVFRVLATADPDLDLKAGEEYVGELTPDRFAPSGAYPIMLHLGLGDCLVALSEVTPVNDAARALVALATPSNR